MNVKFKLIVLLIVILTVVISKGCKPKAYVDYSNNLTGRYSIDLESASKNPDLVEILMLNQVKKWKLDPKGEVLHYYTDSNLVYSIYSKFILELEKPGTYVLEIESLCNCLGFRKFLFVPLIQLNNDYGYVENEIRNA